MTRNYPAHVLYMAHGWLSAQEQQALQEALSAVQAGLSGTELPPLCWTLVTNQKAAFLAGRDRAPQIAVVEFGQMRQRLNFCAQLLARWPAVSLIAVTNTVVEGSAIPFAQTLAYPMGPPALQGAIRAILQLATASELLRAGEVSLDTQNRTVNTPRGQHHITPKQSALLQMLMSRRGEVISRREIMETIWETTFLEDTRTLDVHIRWLREQIEHDPSNPQYILTVRGKGYSFCPKPGIS
jgi:DNA-binding response OmpR family regulator